jgi:hypothetical protein
VIPRWAIKISSSPFFLDLFIGKYPLPPEAKLFHVEDVRSGHL